MRYLDRSFVLAVVMFLLGSLVGGFFVLTVPSIRGPLITLLQTRMLAPIRTVSRFGSAALILLVFLNNSLPAALSFIYPLMIAKINWTPPLSAGKKRALLGYYTWLCAFLVGLFGFGVALAIGWIVGGGSMFFNLVTGASVHGPIELLSILLCVSEPMRLAQQCDHIDLMTGLRRDRRLLVFCLSMLLLSAAIEVLAGV